MLPFRMIDAQHPRRTSDSSSGPAPILRPQFGPACPDPVVGLAVERDNILPSQAITFSPTLRPHKPFRCNTYEKPRGVEMLRLTGNPFAVRRLAAAFLKACSLGDDAVGPLYQADKNCGTAEFCSPLIQICFRDPTGPAAGPSRKNGNVFGHNFFKRFAERRPAHWHDRIHRGLSHQIGGLSREET